MTGFGFDGSSGFISQFGSRSDRTIFPDLDRAHDLETFFETDYGPLFAEGSSLVGDGIKLAGGIELLERAFIHAEQVKQLVVYRGLVQWHYPEGRAAITDLIFFRDIEIAGEEKVFSRG